MKVFISAAEASSDTHAAEVLKRLVTVAEKRGEPLDAFGVGGPKLRAAGLREVIPAERFLAMGFVEVVKRLPEMSRFLAQLENAAEKEKPEVALLCDYPEFHLKLAERLRAQGVRTICYIPPKIWVWRKGRIRKLEALYDRVLSILPFEAKTYENSKVAFEYVGNPLVDELPLDLSREVARDRLGIEEGKRVLLLMAGSRPSEFKFHLRPLLEAAVRIRRELSDEPLLVLMPLPETVRRDVFQSHFEPLLQSIDGANSLDLRVSQGDAWLAMKASDAAIIKSGTSSLEAALLDCPHVVVYRAHPFSEFLFKHVVRYKNAISLTNLVLDGERVVEELILERFTVEEMVLETLRLMKDDARVKRMRTAFAEIRTVLNQRGPSLRVANIVREIAALGRRA